MDAFLSNELRKMMKTGHSLVDARQKLIGKGYSTGEISDAIRDFYEDEASDADEKLVSEIERRLSKGDVSKGDLLQDIFADLVKRHKPFEVEKAMLRARVEGKRPLKSEFESWTFYTYVQLSVLLSTVIIGFIYPLMWLATLFILFEMLIASLGVPTNNAFWRQEITVMPFGGVIITDGVFGYNGLTGNYFRWWVLDPARALLLFFITLGMAATLLSYGWKFLVICLVLAAVSSLSFSIKEPGRSGPPYDR